MGHIKACSGHIIHTDDDKDRKEFHHVYPQESDIEENLDKLVKLIKEDKLKAIELFVPYITFDISSVEYIMANVDDLEIGLKNGKIIYITCRDTYLRAKIYKFLQYLAFGNKLQIFDYDFLEKVIHKVIE